MGRRVTAVIDGDTVRTPAEHVRFKWQYCNDWAAPDPLVLAFKPADDSTALHGHRWGLYAPDYSSPYDVPHGDDLMRVVSWLIEVDRFAPEEYPPIPGAIWTYLDYWSVVNEDPRPVDQNGEPLRNK